MFMTVILDIKSWFTAADRRAQFEKLEYTEEDYQKELEHIEQVKLLIFQFIGIAWLFRVSVGIVMQDG